LGLKSIVWLQGGFELTEERIPTVIQDLQVRKIPTLALTALGTGKYGKIDDFVAYRINQLSQFQMDFSQAVSQKEIVFDHLKPVRGSYPEYRKGILFTNWFENSKGVVLAAFLEKIGRRPQKIIFFDDSMRNLLSVEKEMKKAGIPVELIHYQAERLMYDTLDKGVAGQQITHLLRHRKWLDDEVLRQMQETKS